jgi:hypothetical protein
MFVNWIAGTSEHQEIEVGVADIRRSGGAIVPGFLVKEKGW